MPSTEPTSRRIPGAALIWISILVFAAANSIVAAMRQIGAESLIDGRNPITFCNVLFVGNLCAFIGLFVIFRKTWTRANLARLSRGDWVALVVLGLLSSALAPALTFIALERTTVTNVVLVSRLEPPIFLALSAIFLAERPSRWTVIGAAVSLLGVALIVVLDPATELMLGGGELYAALGAAALAASTCISKTRLGRIPLGIFTVFRTGLGAVIFFIAANYLYGPSHFVDVFAPVLWQWMLVYGLLVVVGGQLAWFQGIKTTSTDQVSLASSFSPVAGVFFAFLLLGEAPRLAQYLGGAVIMLGIGVAQLGPRLARGRQRDTEPMVATDDAHHALVLRDLEMEGRVGFRGI